MGHGRVKVFTHDAVLVAEALVPGHPVDGRAVALPAVHQWFDTGVVFD